MDLIKTGDFGIYDQLTFFSFSWGIGEGVGKGTLLSEDADKAKEAVLTI